MNKDQAAAIAKEIVRAWDFDETDMPIKSPEQGERLEKAIAEAITEASTCKDVSEQKLGEYRPGKYTSGEIKAMIAEAFKRGAACKDVSDEEIAREAEHRSVEGYLANWTRCELFQLGAKWMRDEIKRRGSEG